MTTAIIVIECVILALLLVQQFWLIPRSLRRAVESDLKMNKAVVERLDALRSVLDTLAANTSGDAAQILEVLAAQGVDALTANFVRALTDRFRTAGIDPKARAGRDDDKEPDLGERGTIPRPKNGRARA